MYLKEIIASGFKSFAEKIDIKLDNDITCIVGPNGSGKSNIVDAVRWVLGEQSVKSLRGSSSMQDIIFSGSKTRNPLNVAYVELIFDNSDHYLNIPYTEISIKRRIYRSGENEYFLNGERCRLKDITNLLLDSNLGKASFNIISQGEVEQIFSSSSLDRRTIIEEAAGVLKYKKRKEEALRKLEKTHINIDRVNDIIKELEGRIDPLKEQSDLAKVYLENKEGLDKYEVALYAYDIENMTALMNEKKAKKEKLSKDLVDYSNTSNKDEVSLLSDNNKLSELQKEYNDIQRELVDVTSEVENLNGQKKLLKEQNKNNKSDENQNKIREALELISKLKKDISVSKEEIDELNKNLKVCSEKENNTNKELEKIKTEKNMYVNDYNSHDKDIINLTNKSESLKQEISDGGIMPQYIKDVLNETSLTGIDTTISNILDTEEEYMTALSVASNANKNFIITKDESSATAAIKYLKDNHLGRATFFPLTVIKERYVDDRSLNTIKDDPNFIGVLSDLLKYNNKYENIVKNQFGNIILAKDLKGANAISRKIDNRYKIITLEGDVVNVGGSLTGGSLKPSRTIISAKQELTNVTRNLSLLEEEKYNLEKNIKNINEKVSEYENNIFTISKEKASIEEEISIKIKNTESLEKELKDEEESLSNLESISNNSVDKKEKELIKNYNEKVSVKEKYELKLKSLSKEISSLQDSIIRKEADNKEKNSKIKELEKESNNLDIDINKLDIKIDSMLDILSTDYELTYERAKEEYKLDIDPDEARSKIKKYRSKIKEIGMVNLNSIDEYEEVSTRYNYLLNQKDDLYNAEDTLLNIMKEMDEVMKEEFSATFKSINAEFQKVFVSLFGGGKASLELTNPGNILETGVDIIASPPGKKLTTISLLSGGEKTLTAISLLFAILNIKTVPFCLFDEVEAALDEENVKEFGEYLSNYKGKTEFLIITHKKKTMEYAKTLYGITMQESGVSKLVSVNLENKNEVI